MYMLLEQAARVRCRQRFACIQDQGRMEWPYLRLDNTIQYCLGVSVLTTIEKGTNYLDYFR
jgi:hypothetical protein